MSEISFYHLQRQPLEAVLPALVEKCLSREWRVVIEVPNPERLAALDDHLWIYRDDSFLPHATDESAGCENEPILLTSHSGNFNNAHVRFLVDGASLPEDTCAYERIILIFDGNDDEILAKAREEWRKLRTLNITATYWQQDESGRWSRKG